MSKQRAMQKAALNTVGRKPSGAKGLSGKHKVEGQRKVDLVPQGFKNVGGIIGIKNSLNLKKYEGLAKKEPKLRAKMNEENKIYQYNNSISGGRDPVANAYNMIMHQSKMQALEKKHDKISTRYEAMKRKLDFIQRSGQLIDAPLRGLSQMSQTMTRKAAYTQMVGNQSGVNRADLAVASGLMASNDAEFY